MYLNKKTDGMIKVITLGGALIILLLAGCASTSKMAPLEQREPSLYDEDVYLLAVFCDENYKNPSWGLPKVPNQGREGAATAKEVIRHFSKQPEEQRKKGIFIESITYRTPDTEIERKWRSTKDWKLYYDESWRKAEAKLIEDLVKECKKENILLYVNLTSNLVGKWEKLSP